MKSENPYKTLHSSNPQYGRTGVRTLPYVQALIDDVKGLRILDFGCGKGVLGLKLQEKFGLDVNYFDPYIPEFSAQPTGPFDVVLSTDVLEHVHEDELDDVLAHVASLSTKAVFIVSLTFADTLLDSGDNAHVTIRSATWWQNRLSKHFPTVVEVATRQDTAVCFVTWQPRNQTIAKLRRLRRSQRILKHFMHFALSPVKSLASFGPFSVSSSQIKSELVGKSVALVGNAKSLSNSEFGTEIDSHDVVIRLNRGPIIFARSHGTRTDIVATSMPVSSGLLDNRNVKRVLWMTPKRGYAPLWAFKRQNTFFYPKSAFATLCSKLGSRPSTGIMTIDFLLSTDISKLKLFGFDGFKSLSLSGDRTEKDVIHDFVREEKYITNLKKEERRLEIK